MATLLDGVNRVLKRVGEIKDDLTTLTSDPKQISINIAIQIWNEVMIALYTKRHEPVPAITGSSTITLVTDDRDYALPADFIQIHWPLHDQTNGYYINEYPGGFLELSKHQQIPANETGRPYYGAIRPTDGELYLDSIPTSNENGAVYTYYYTKDSELSDATDTFPFNDHAYIALVPAVAELWSMKNQNKFDKKTYDMALGTASIAMTENQLNESYLPKLGSSESVTDPYAN